MKLVSCALCVLVLLFPGPASGTEPYWAGPWTKASELVSVLDLVPEGKAVLQEARSKDPQFEKKVRAGAASFTERAVRSRYSASTGKENKRESVQVSINKNHSLADAALDLAHELVHFTKRKPLDPYKPEFGMVRFVKTGIEGEGGELPAWALEKAFAAFPQHKYCEQFRKEDSFQQEAARLAYYAAGKYYGGLNAELRAGVPELSAAPSTLASGLGAKPYPALLAGEFLSLRKALCLANREKIRQLSKPLPSGGRDRNSASVKEEARALSDFHLRHCLPGKK